MKKLLLISMFLFVSCTHNPTETSVAVTMPLPAQTPTDIVAPTPTATKTSVPTAEPTQPPIATMTPIKRLSDEALVNAYINAEFRVLAIVQNPYAGEFHNMQVEVLSRNVEGYWYNVCGGWPSLSSCYFLLWDASSQNQNGLERRFIARYGTGIYDDDGSSGTFLTLDNNSLHFTDAETLSFHVAGGSGGYGCDIVVAQDYELNITTGEMTLVDEHNTCEDEGCDCS
ncbi:MAG: hypothetical protein ACPG8W_12090 [Candidatus Promineifilaceae bacterium]